MLRFDNIGRERGKFDENFGFVANHTSYKIYHTFAHIQCIDKQMVDNVAGVVHSDGTTYKLTTRKPTIGVGSSSAMSSRGHEPVNFGVGSGLPKPSSRVQIQYTHPIRVEWVF